jgi:hypothetical protein
MSWLRALGRWLAEPRLAWLTLLVVVLAFVTTLRSGATDLHIRLTGVLLEWLGIGTVAYGVRDTRTLFGLPSFTSMARDWLTRFPPWRRDVILMTGTGHLEIKGGDAHLEVWSNVDAAAPLERQVQALMNNVNRLRDRLNQMRDEMQKQVREHSEALDQERRVRAKDDEGIQARLKAAETGGLHVTLAGLVWLLLGVVLTTLSQEIAAWRS